MRNINSKQSGFTLVELLIAVIIISILVTIIVPVISNRAADARIAAAKADLEAIANAQSQVALDTGYLTRLHVLDDTGEPEGTVGYNDPDFVRDTIRSEDQNIAAGNPTFLFIDAKTGVLYNGAAGTNLWNKVEANPESIGWKGPYLTLDHKERKVTYANPWPAAVAGTVPDVPYGAPLDPWGNPYLLFTRLGLVNEFSTGGAGGGTIATAISFDGTSYQADRFDRPTVLSFGPNGVPGDNANPEFGMGDDIFRQF